MAEVADRDAQRQHARLFVAGLFEIESERRAPFWRQFDGLRVAAKRDLGTRRHRLERRDSGRGANLDLAEELIRAVPVPI